MHTVVRHSLVGSIALLTLAACAAATPKIDEQVYAPDRPEDWAKTIDSLPVEVHGVAPNMTEYKTIAGIDHGASTERFLAFGITKPELPSLRRVVVYIGAGPAPGPEQFCAADAPRVPPDEVPPNTILLRMALCDGSREVAYAHDGMPDATATIATVNDAVNRLKHEMVKGLTGEVSASRHYDTLPS
jgi:hypothetical protein